MFCRITQACKFVESCDHQDHQITKPCSGNQYKDQADYHTPFGRIYTCRTFRQLSNAPRRIQHMIAERLDVER